MAQIDTISKAEAIKQQSRQLRGTLARDLADTATPFDKDGYTSSNFTASIRGTTATARPSASSAATTRSGSSWCACGSPAGG